MTGILRSSTESVESVKMPGMVLEGENNAVTNKPPDNHLESELPAVDISIERLYDNVCEMESSCDGSLSRQSFGSEAEESRIDSELRLLVGGEASTMETVEEGDGTKNAARGGETGKVERACAAKKIPGEHLDSDLSTKSALDNKISPENRDKTVRKPNPSLNNVKKGRNGAIASDEKMQGGLSEDPSEASIENPDLGPFLLKHARDLVAGENHKRALDYVLRAAKSFEKCSDGKPNLDFVMCLHVLAAIQCSLEQYEEAIPVLEKSIKIPDLGENADHALAKFSGCMQLGDVYWLLGNIEQSIKYYSEGLEIQQQALGSDDPRVGETCRYLSEAYLQALQFSEAERYCQMAIDIHKDRVEDPFLEEISDRRLMALICETKGDYEAALEHLVMASMAMVSNGQEIDVAPVDCSIGDEYLSLSRFDEAVFAYQKALTVFKSSKGENHSKVANVFIRLAVLYNRTGKLRESRSYLENALKIYSRPPPGTPVEDIASGLTDISSIYESMSELEQAIKWLKKALKIYDGALGHQSTIAGIEAQLGVLYYRTEHYSESYESFKSSISKLRACGEKKSVFFGLVLNQMGLVCMQLFLINEAANLFEEAKIILDQEYGPHHLETLGVYSNLAGVYDAMGRYVCLFSWI